jgi:hypothetical protein
MDHYISLLGGKCVVCGSTEELHFDHIDPATKSFTISEGWAKAPAEVLKELEKCQLLCKAHHIGHGTGKHSTAQHGSTTMYSHQRCRCEECREAWNANDREYKRRWRAKRKELGLKAV